MHATFQLTSPQRKQIPHPNRPGASRFIQSPSIVSRLDVSVLFLSSFKYNVGHYRSFGIRGTLLLAGLEPIQRTAGREIVSFTGETRLRAAFNDK